MAGIPDLDRRGFALGAMATLIAAGGATRVRAAGGIPSTVSALYDRAIVIDALASPSSWNVPFPPPGPLTQAQLDNVRASGITAVNLTVGKPGGLDATVKEIGFWLGQIARHGDYLRLVTRHADIAAAKREGKLGIIFGFQGMGMIGTDLDLIDAFAAMSVKIMQLTYNDRNALAAGSSLPESEGLTPFGREAIARMNALGVLVDVGHANPATAIQAAEASAKPITISHTGSRAVFDSQRNLPDTAFRAVAEKGGVVGIYLMPFLGRDPVSASRALFNRHLVHALNVCGEDHVGIGSDQSITPVDISPAYMEIVRKTAEARQKAGIGAPGEADSPVTVPQLNAVRRMEMIAADLSKAGYPARVVEKVIGGNFDQLFRAIWPA
ncbi:MAG: peptidase M19, renal dipeptidase [Sphingobium sp.]|nr:MAG: peptidase M19, renal dipeptidase [Sphingobium sp.]